MAFRLLVCWMFLCLLSLSHCCADVLECVGVSSTGEVANGDCMHLTVSADGRYVAFDSDATNLVPHETWHWNDAYVRDRFEGLTYCITVTPTGAAANDYSIMRGISDDGRYVVFRSDASNLVPEQTSGDGDLFVRDTLTATTELVSISPSGEPWPKWIYFAHMSGDGRFVYLYHWEGEGYGFYRRDREEGTTELLWRPGYGFWMDISDDGRYWAFEVEVDGIVPGDTNGVGDVFLWDRESDEIEWVSVSITGGAGNGSSDQPSISGNGRFVAFTSHADNLVGGDTNGLQDVFLRDRLTGTTQRVNVSAEGQEANAVSYSSGLSRDGRCVLFTSEADNLLPDTPSGLRHVYIWDREADVLELASVGDCDQDSARLSLDGRFVVFASTVAPLTAATTPGLLRAYLRDRQTFGDVPVGSWAYHAVSACYNAGIVAGYPDGFYRPHLPVTRDQMAVYVARGLVGQGADVPTGPATATFPDVPLDFWAYDCVEYVAAEQITEGYPNGYYRPEYAVDRAQMATYVARARGWVAIGEDMATAPELFPDVPAGHWAGTAVEACVDSGVVQGYPDGLYRPNAQVTRDQMAVYVARAFGLVG